VKKPGNDPFGKQTGHRKKNRGHQRSGSKTGSRTKTNNNCCISFYRPVVFPHLSPAVSGPSSPAGNPGPFIRETGVARLFYDYQRQRIPCAGIYPEQHDRSTGG